MSSIIEAQTPTHYREEVARQAWSGRVLVFLMPLLVFGLAWPFNGAELMGAAPALRPLLNFLHWGVITPAALVGLLVMLRVSSVRWHERICLWAGMVVASGMQAIRWVGVDFDYAFPPLSVSFYMSALLMVARFPLRNGITLALITMVASIAMEYYKLGPVPEANFTALTVVIIHVLVIYATAMLERESVRAFDVARALEREARTDRLTGLPNRVAADETLAGLFADDGSPRKVAVMLLDVDYFKAINDQRGHASGDAVLRELGRELRLLSQGAGWQAYRYGGEEFILLGEAGADAAKAFGERVLGSLRSMDLAVLRGHRPLSATIGLAYGPAGRPARLELFLRAADQALYAGKDEGRDRLLARAVPLAAEAGTNEELGA